MVKSALTAMAVGLGIAKVPARAQTNSNLKIGVTNPAGSSATVLAMDNSRDNALVVVKSGSGPASAIWGVGNGPAKIGILGLAQAGGFAAVLARAENSQYGIAADTDNGASAGGVFSNTGGGAALLIQGRIKVSGGAGVQLPTGSVTGTAGQKVVPVSRSFIKSDGIVLAHMAGNPYSGASIQWTEIIAGVGFNIHLTAALGANTMFVYLILEQS